MPNKNFDHKFSLSFITFLARAGGVATDPANMYKSKRCGLAGQKAGSSSIYAAETMPFTISKLKARNALKVHARSLAPPNKKRRRNKTLPKVSSGKQTRNTHTYRKIVRCVVCTQRVWSTRTPECPRVCVFGSTRRKLRKYRFSACTKGTNIWTLYNSTMIYVLWAARLFSSKFIFFPFVPHFHWTIYSSNGKNDVHSCNCNCH